MRVRRRGSGWILFALTAAVWCLLLAFRPIPAVYAANDTGRYVQGVKDFCSSSGSEDVEDKELSYNIFYSAVYPACWFDSNKLLLLEVAAFMPLTFLLFIKWQKGTLLWAYSLIFSMAGLELMTNAMRQGLSMFLFCGAIALAKRHKFFSMILGAMSVMAHSSGLFYLPLLLWLMGVRIPRNMIKISVVSVFILLGLISVMFERQIIFFFQGSGGDFAFYSSIYADNLNVLFILYMTLPLFWLYGVRYLKNKKDIKIDEKMAFIYSTAILILCFFLFPAILYRFAMFAVVLQIFLVGNSEKPGRVGGGYMLGGTLVHLLIMVLFSKYYTVLLNG